MLTPGFRALKPKGKSHVLLTLTALCALLAFFRTPAANTTQVPDLGFKALKPKGNSHVLFAEGAIFYC
jgi:hypothetical protein